MKFDSKSLLFEIIRKTHQETILSHYHWLYPQEGRSRFLLKNPKNMNHNYDVINLCFNKTRQKVFLKKTWFWVNILFTLIKIRSFFTLVVTELYQKVRKLPVSHNFPRKTTPDVLVECSSIFWWKHSKLSYWEVFHFHFVYQLMSHVIRPKIFSHLLLS